MFSVKIIHPFNNDLSFLYGTIFIDKQKDSNSHNKNVCIFADGKVGRSPTGTNVSGRLVIHYARGEIAFDEKTTLESILGTKFDVRVVEETKFSSYRTIIPEIRGEAFITRKHEFFIDPDDSLGNGFFK
ncbi:MAG: proline racemase family protein [Candidatus Neomarinimicrobiota bacterium]